VILLSLVLVLLSLGLLIAGLAGASQGLVWASILSSVAAGTCLALAVLRRRAAPEEIGADDDQADAPTAGDGVVTRATGGVPEGTAPWSAPESGGPVAANWGSPAGRSAEAAGEITPAGPPAAELDEATEVVSVPGGEHDADAYPDPPDEPPEEDVSAPDALRVTGLDTDVYVVDGRPRYHLQDCPHLADREVVPLPVPEAREAGFTPCSLCMPDSTLARQARKAGLDKAGLDKSGRDTAKGPPPRKG
jgi:hypothetical protein